MSLREGKCTRNVMAMASRDYKENNSQIKNNGIENLIEILLN